MVTKKAKIGSFDIAYRQNGEQGPPVIFIHGNSFSSEIFHKQLESDLADSYRLIAFDLPGHGGSSWSDNPENDYTLENFARILAAFVKELDIENAVFAGWCLGGHILLEAADLLPHAGGMMIFGTPPVGTPESFIQGFLPNPAAAFSFQADTTEEEQSLLVKALFHPEYPHLPEELLESYRNTDPREREIMGKVVASAAGKDEVEIVRNMKPPLAVLMGEGDQLTNLDYVENLAYNNLYQDEVIVIPGTGHAPQWEKPEVFNSVLNGFLEHVHSNSF